MEDKDTIKGRSGKEPWMIGLSDAADERVLEWARSFASPPSLELSGARLDSEPFAQERRAIRLVAEEPTVTLTLRPVGVCVNPVFEIRNAPSRLSRVVLNRSSLSRDNWAWDGKTFWLNATLHGSATLRLAFSN